MSTHSRFLDVFGDFCAQVTINNNRNPSKCARWRDCNVWTSFISYRNGGGHGHGEAGASEMVVNKHVYYAAL